MSLALTQTLQNVLFIDDSIGITFFKRFNVMHGCLDTLGVGWIEPITLDPLPVVNAGLKNHIENEKVKRLKPRLNQHRVYRQ